MILRLCDLLPGQEAIINSFDSDEISIKLMEMGCLPGEKILLEQVAPLGDPLSIAVSGYSLSLRKNEAEHIFVVLTV